MEESDVGKSFFAFFETDPSVTSKSSTTSPPSDVELLKYLSDKSSRLSSLDSYPRIKQLFFHFNTPLPSSAAVERLFSVAGMVYSPQRRSMSDKTFRQLVLMRANRNC